MKFKMVILLMLLVVSFCPVNTDSVQLGGDNVCTKTKPSYHVVELTKTVQTTENCGFLRKVADFFKFWDDICVKGKRTINRKEKYTEKRVTYTIQKDCCRGYYNDSGICKQACEDGKYGQNCSKECECPENAFPACDKDSGNCTCKSGYTGTNCKEECDNEHFGEGCKYTCPCENNSTCDRTDGSCNCTSPGWTGQYCNQKCSNNAYGFNCSSECNCEGNQICDHVSGCLCQAGYTGSNCNESCGGWTYGPNCRESCVCSERFTNSCDTVNGTCHCKPGYMGLDCSDLCSSGTYGENCKEQCDCSPHQFCLPTNGSCYCPFGLTGEFCNQTCSQWTFGLGCGRQCSCVRNSTLSCNNTDGYCLCKEGWNGTNCERVHRFSDTGIQSSEMPNSKSQTIVYPLIGGAIAVALLAIFITLAVSIRKRKSRKKNFEPDYGTPNPTYNYQIPENEDIDLRDNTNGGPDEYSHMRLQENGEYDDFRKTKTPSNNILPSEEYDSIRKVKENLAMGNENDSSYDEFKKSNRSGNDVTLNDVYDKCGPTIKDEEGYDTFIKSKQVEGHYD